MRDINRAERLLSLFTSPDSAAGIVGDLSEEWGQRGSLWFCRQVLGTAFSLGRGALFEAPLVLLTLVALGFFLLAVSGVVGAAAAGYVAQLFNPRVPLQLLVAVFLTVPACVAIWWYGATLAGTSLVAASPRRGMLACLLLFCAVELLLLALGVNMLSHRPILTALPTVWTIGLTVPLFLLRGAARAHRRRMERLA